MKGIYRVIDNGCSVSQSVALVIHAKTVQDIETLFYHTIERCFSFLEAKFGDRESRVPSPNERVKTVEIENFTSNLQ